jgi:pimeloyl-ACP methyl ester carboxylesterase
MSRFVLVHGAWLGGWCWDNIAKDLRSAGHEVYVPNLPGHGDDQTPVSAITLESYVDALAPLVTEGSVVVGHSMAGIVISSLAERIPEAMASLIYVAAYLRQSGESIVGVSAAATDSLVGPNMVPAADWSTISIRPEALEEVFAADAPRSAIEQLHSRARPEPAGPFNTPIPVTPEKFGTVRQCYVRTSKDRAVTPRLQDAMLAKTPCGEVITLNTSHTPFFAAPAELAATLIQLASHEKGAAAAELLYELREAGIPATMVWTTLESAQHWLVVTLPRDCRSKGGCTAENLCRRIGEHVFEKSKFGAVIPKILVMNDDIDATNTQEVVWAFATRCHPYTGEIHFNKEATSPLVAFLESAEKTTGKTTKVVYNCLPPEDWGDRIPKRTSFRWNYPKELREKVIRSWSAYGFPKDANGRVA